MNKLKGLADIIILAFSLFYIGMSLSEHNTILALLCAVVAVLAYNHLVRQQD